MARSVGRHLKLSRRFTSKAWKVVPVAVVSGGSFFSRACSFAALVFAARTLELPDFGFFAFSTAISIGIANTAAVGFGDMVASVAVRSPAQLRRLTLMSTLVSAAAVLITLLSLFSSANIVPMLAILLLCTGLNMLQMQALLGLKGPSVAAGFGYYMPSLLRLAVLVLPPDNRNLPSFISVTALAAATGAAIAGVATGLALRDVLPTNNDQRQFDIWAALTIGLTWFVLNQADLTALSLLVGYEASGLFTPQVRLFEALSAFAIAARFVSARSMFLGRPTVQLPLTVVVTLYIPSAVLVVLFGSHLSTYMLGNPGAWNAPAAVLLALAYFLSAISSVFLQFQVASLAWNTIRLAALVSIGTTAVVMPIAVSIWGVNGAAVGDVVVYGVWAILLSRHARIA